MPSASRWTVHRTVLLAALLALMAAGLGFARADAASPMAGTVTASSRSVSWSGGPFVAPNVTGAAGDPTCTASGTDCDDFALTVSAPSDYGSTHTLNIQVGWSNTAADFDVYVLDHNGTIVGTSASSADPEQVILPPTSGDYTVRVVPYAPAGESYTARATLTTIPANPAPGTATPPSFTDYAAPGTLPDANNAGEPSIGTSFKTASTMFQSYLSTYKVTFDDTTSPAADTWTDASAGTAKGCPVGGVASLDPILYTDHQTGRTFESQLDGVGSLTCYTDDDGAHWSPSQGAGLPAGADHQTLGGGPFSASTPVGSLPTSTYKDAVYYCSQDIATALCAVSRDGGTTFGPGVPTYSLLDCGGLHGHVKIAPDGTAYLPNKSCGATQAAVVSTDSGTSWKVYNVPGATPGDSDPSVGVGSKGSVYFGYVGADGRPGVAVSHDRGKTWEHRQTVGTKYAIKNAVFPTVVAGDDDRASFAYIGTPTGGNYQDNVNFHGVWHLYVDTTYDGGKTWVTSDASPGNTVQQGSICTSGTTCGNDRNLLDFIDVTLDSHGRVTAGFADGCIKTCETDPKHASDTTHPDGRAAYATIARQSAGRTLYSKYDPARPPAVRNLKVTSMSVTESNERLHAVYKVRNTGNRTLTNVNTRVKDGSTVKGTRRIDTIRPGVTRTLSITYAEGRDRRHVIVAVADPNNVIRESNEKDNRLTRIHRG